MVDGGILNEITQEFVNAFDAGGHQLESTVKGLFYLLASIQISIAGFMFFMRGNLQQATIDIIKLLLFMAVSYALILDGHKLLLPILNGFIHAGSSVSGVNEVSPSGIASKGFAIGQIMLSNFSGLGWITHPFLVLLTVVLTVFIILLYVLIAAEVVIVIIKSYYLVAMCGFFAAFSANEAVRTVTINYLKSFLGLGLQLFTLYSIIGIGMNIGDDWDAMIKKAAENHEIMPFFVIAGCVLIIYKLVKTLPPFVAQMAGVSGFRSYGDEAIMLAANAGIQSAGVGLQAAKMLGGGSMQTGKAIGQGIQSFNAAQGAKAGFSQAGKTIATSVGHAIKNISMGENKHQSFGQKVNAHMGKMVNAQKASAPSGNFKPNGIKK
tara:strand:- start:3221 stop:4357 length:1137 start_codon:yes stop_codon:yes gene_type:complete